MLCVQSVMSTTSLSRVISSGWSWRAAWRGGGTISSVCRWSRTMIAACHWNCSSACRWCCAAGAVDCLWLTRACSTPVAQPWMSGSPALCPQQSPLSSPVCPVVRRPSSWCCFPSTPLHRRGRSPQQSGKTSAAVFCRCWRMPAFWGSTVGPVLSCTEHLCWQSSPVCHPALA